MSTSSTTCTKDRAVSDAQDNVQYAIVREERHEHLYAKAAGDEGYSSVACLGGYPRGMFCAWQIPETKFVQHKFRSQRTAERYVERKLGWDAVLDIFYPSTEN